DQARRRTEGPQVRFRHLRTNPESGKWLAVDLDRNPIGRLLNLHLRAQWQRQAEKYPGLYHRNFNATCTTRPGCALRIRPKLPEETVTFGASKWAWLKALKN